jgi:hypothetical protein
MGVNLMNKGIKARVTRPLEGFGVEIVLYIEDGARRSVGLYNLDAQGYDYFEHKPGDAIPLYCKLCLSEEEALAMYIGLNKEFGPQETSATDQQLAAVKDHMAHISIILDRVLQATILKECSAGGR